MVDNRTDHDYLADLLLLVHLSIVRRVGWENLLQKGSAFITIVVCVFFCL